MPKKKDATQDKGVSDENKNIKPDTQEEEIKSEENENIISERDKEIENIARRIEADREKDLGIKEEEKEQESEPEPEKKDEPESKDETDEEGEDEEKEKEAEHDKVDGSEEKTVEIIVDGVKKTVPVSKVTDAGIRALQKESAADVRLEEAVKLLKEAKELKEKEPEKNKTPDKELADLGVDKKKISELREAIQYGEEEAAAAAIEELIRLGRGGNKEPVIPEGVMTVEEYEKKEREKKEREIIDKFSLPPDKGGFADIADDPYLFAALNAEVDAELAKGTPNTWELYESAGKKVRKWRGDTAGTNTVKEAADQKAKDELAKKREKKAKAASATIPGVNAKTKTEKKVTPEPTVSDIIQEMRKARGQPV